MKKTIGSLVLIFELATLVCLTLSTLNARPATNARSPFMLVLIPDTQYYSLRDPGTYNAQAEWIVDYRQIYKIKFAIHLGDITHNNTEVEWQAASAAHDILDNAGVPYSVIPGNHDNVGQGKTRDTKRYNQYFGLERFDERAWYGGHFRNTNDNNYWFFEVDDLKFMIVGLEFAPSKEALCWADSLLLHYQDRRVIVATHCYQAHGGDHQCNCGTAYDIVGSGGNTTWNEFVRRHSNIFLVVSGHIGDSEFNIRTGNSGNTVYEILTDYQFEQRNNQSHGNGWLRTLKFFPDENRIDVKILTVLDEVYEFNQDDYPKYPGDPVHTYSIDYDMSGPVEGKYLRLSNRFNDMTVQAGDRGNQFLPSISMAPNGDFAVAWMDSSENSAGTYQVLTRGFELSGRPKFPGITVNSQIGSSNQNPDIAIGSEGQFVVVWENHNGYGDFDVKMVGYNADGTEYFGEITVNSVSTGNQTSPAVAIAEDGTFIVVWEDDADNNGKSEILMAGFHPDGSKRVSDAQINTQSGGNQNNPDIVMKSDGDGVIVWESDNEADDLFQINVVGIDINGAERFSEMTVNAVTSGQHSNPSVDMNTDGSFVVTWEDDSDGNEFYEIYVAGFNSNGIKQFGNTTVNAIPGGQQLRSSIAMSEIGDFIVTFQDDNDGNGYYQIFASEFNADGLRKTESDFTVNENGGGQQFNPVIAMKDINSYVILWEDDMNNNNYYEVLARGYDNGETYVTAISQATDEMPRNFELYQNYPNPFNPETIIRYEIPNATNVTLTIYNTVGQIVEHLVNQKQESGSYSVKWNASHYSTGLYFYRIVAGDFQQVKQMLLIK